MKKTYFTYLGSVMILALAFLGFVATGPGATQKVMKTPSFAYTPPTTEGQPNGITLALVSPKYAINGTESDINRNVVFSTFKKNLEGDIMELLTSRGYTVRGPFLSRDEMVYDDKEKSDLAIIVDISPQFKAVSGGFAQTAAKCSNGTLGQSFKGTLALYGTINLQALEPITGEKMWSKQVEIPEGTTPDIKSNAVCGGTDLDKFLYLIDKDGNVANPVIDLLQSSYEQILRKCYIHLDPSEFKRLEGKIKQLKAK